MRKLGKWTLISSAAVVCGLTAMPVAAQQEAEEAASDDRSNVIVVTARQREEDLLTVPVPVTVVTEEQLDRDQINQVTDLARTTPALEVSQTFGGEANGGARLRGLGTGVFNASVSPSVAFVVDQVPQGNLVFPILFDIAQVEVLRGPQGTLFGQGSSAGVMNVSTKMPSLDGISGDFGLSLADNGTAGSEVGERVADAAVNAPLSDSIALRLAARYRRRSGLQHNVTLDEPNVLTDFAVRGRLLLEPTETVSIVLSAEYANQDSSGRNFFALSKLPDSTRPFGPPGATLGAIASAAYLNPAGCAMPEVAPRAEFYCSLDDVQRNDTSIGFSAIVDVALTDNLDLTSVTSYRTADNDTVVEEFSRLTTSPSARNSNIQIDSRQISQELRFTYSGNGFDIVSGALYTDFSTESTPLIAGPFGVNTPSGRIGFGVCTFDGTFCPVPTQFTYQDTSNDILAFFADATVEVDDGLNLFGGLRYSTYENTSATGINTLTATRTSTIEDDNLSGRLGLSYDASPSTTFYASYAIGYKPPALVVPATPGNPIINLAPEESKAWELGARTQVGPLLFSGNVFHTTIENFQAQTTVFVGTALVSQALNIPSIKSAGFEVTMFGRITDNFSLNAGYQYNEVKYPSGFLGDDGVNIGGRQFINAPRHKFTVSSDYTVPVSDSMEFFVNANIVYKSDVLLAPRSSPDFVDPAHELINGGVGMQDPDGAWRASLFVRNLTKEREPVAFLASTFANQLDGGVRAWPSAGLTARVVGIMADFSFSLTSPVMGGMQTSLAFRPFLSEFTLTRIE